MKTYPRPFYNWLAEKSSEVLEGKVNAALLATALAFNIYHLSKNFDITFSLIFFELWGIAALLLILAAKVKIINLKGINLHKFTRQKKSDSSTMLLHLFISIGIGLGVAISAWNGFVEVIDIFSGFFGFQENSLEIVYFSLIFFLLYLNIKDRKKPEKQTLG